MSARFKTLLAVAIIIAASVPLARGNEQPAMPQNSEAPRNDEQRKDQVAEPPIIRSEADRSKGRQTTVPADPAAVFAAKILGSTEDIWSKILPEQTKKQYTPTAMVLYRAATRSACGSIKTDIGAFYCPVDKKIYLDMDYANKMLSEGGMPADYFYTYSITREVGYHVQDVLGILGKVYPRMYSSDQSQSRNLSARIDLMADCLSGVWAYHAYKERSLLDLRIFDRLFAQLSVERAAQTDTATEVIFLRVKIPTEQRSKWFAAGFNSGETKSCDTFRR